ncbi:MAG TPA: hypothetical protein VFC00_03925 [Micromonosporaceae bacterium]|nr:hypothetical protein [Micromonosporaceae bacterium]
MYGRARPVVLSDEELTLRREGDEPSLAWLRLVQGEDDGGPEPRSAAWWLAHAALVVLLSIPAMVFVAVGLAYASR